MDNVARHRDQVYETWVREENIPQLVLYRIDVLIGGQMDESRVEGV